MIMDEETGMARLQAKESTRTGLTIMKHCEKARQVSSLEPSEGSTAHLDTLILDFTSITVFRKTKFIVLNLPTCGTLLQQHQKLNVGQCIYKSPGTAKIKNMNHHTTKAFCLVRKVGMRWGKQGDFTSYIFYNSFTWQTYKQCFILSEVCIKCYQKIKRESMQWIWEKFKTYSEEG